ncbi:hypothetical protein [Marinoscillum pacificum]|uniref:hypothetical protein n=1 Tax=Marinoscillum pacificum TaxID=392723 RepID=UPI0021572C7E|nr:hypothetical protein [Marinoscillum pacificum]
MIQYSPTSLQQVIDWRIKRFPVYRILDNVAWLNNFFDTGEIQLSTFSKFRSYKDEMQGDKYEGQAAIIFDGDDKNMHAITYEAGINAFIMSTTVNLNDQVIDDFKGTCAIKINHPTLFALELSKKLPFVTSGLEGLCDYVEHRSKFLEKQLRTDNLLKTIEELSKYKMDHLMNELTQGMELFAKHKKYSHQEEYRFIWFSNVPTNSTIKVQCPEAIEYCEKILF